ncbi:MAG: hypothetical protein GTO42_01060 [Candidatus Latescibacteria bacterium]|nr:hypothetical protein [Candidatus Latescibacterota bacterium]NIO27118.1 hypothetical protein [Candidatus Latescibacterota bacterium]NIO54642.1 hypothetical protein [Candidatus Latescibacterota bacterium]NIT00725.1 hypothetical protein [Candidatus Latescibacterota bacterium]NIT37648.1 hypothetical protein [Candidatus Latescibacterota bacterium]
MRTRVILLLLIAAFLMHSGMYAPSASEDTQEDFEVMAHEQRTYGKPNPDAPRQLSQFAFLIGKWRCDSKVKGKDGVFETHPATWTGRYILDGYVIADEFRQMGPGGELIQLGQNYRSFDTDKNAWVMKWHDALASTWLDLGPEELGGVLIDDTSITFMHYVPERLAGKLFPPHTLFRLTFSDISENHFTWRAEISTDGEETWDEVQVIEAYRMKD